MSVPETDVEGEHDDGKKQIGFIDGETRNTFSVICASNLFFAG
jgi:hypothetical protein